MQLYAIIYWIAIDERDVLDERESDRRESGIKELQAGLADVGGSVVPGENAGLGQGSLAEGDGEKREKIASRSSLLH